MAAGGARPAVVQGPGWFSLQTHLEVRGCELIIATKDAEGGAEMLLIYAVRLGHLSMPFSKRLHVRLAGICCLLPRSFKSAIESAGSSCNGIEAKHLI